MKNHRDQSAGYKTMSPRFRTLVMACAVLIAGSMGVAMAQQDGDPIPRKGLERGLQQQQESAIPQPQCPAGMVWSAKDDKCVSTLIPQTQTGVGGGSKSPTGVHKQFLEKNR